MRIHPKAILLTAFALLIALLAAIGLTNTLRQGPSEFQAHAQSTLFQPGARVAAMFTAISPELFGTATIATTIFEVIAIDGEWVRLRVDQEKTDEFAQQAYIRIMTARFSSQRAGSTDEEIEQELKEALADPNNPMAALASMLGTNLPSDKDLWINLNAYPAIWFPVN